MYTRIKYKALSQIEWTTSLFTAGWVARPRPSLGVIACTRHLLGQLVWGIFLVGAITHWAAFMWEKEIFDRRLCSASASVVDPVDFLGQPQISLPSLKKLGASWDFKRLELSGLSAASSTLRIAAQRVLFHILTMATSKFTGLQTFLAESPHVARYVKQLDFVHSNSCPPSTLLRELLSQFTLVRRCKISGSPRCQWNTPLIPVLLDFLAKANLVFLRVQNFDGLTFSAINSLCCLASGSARASNRFYGIVVESALSVPPPSRMHLICCCERDFKWNMKWGRNRARKGGEFKKMIDPHGLGQDLGQMSKLWLRYGPKRVELHSFESVHVALDSESAIHLPRALKTKNLLFFRESHTMCAAFSSPELKGAVSRIRSLWVRASQVDVGTLVSVTADTLEQVNLEWHYTPLTSMSTLPSALRVIDFSEVILSAESTPSSLPTLSALCASSDATIEEIHLRCFIRLLHASDPRITPDSISAVHMAWASCQRTPRLIWHVLFDRMMHEGEDPGEHIAKVEVFLRREMPQVHRDGALVVKDGRNRYWPDLDVWC
ncbi:hypothetical protein B0H16DRAFT_1448345 [Mycena metata]|uniref:Uncharacterized protein n=1 Tax=Mycena metata TaxID=1033252 RepID=A0AAD7K9D1_9AGAR|nr:hypothetical protein B0H16DRAFT_1448345 [Mycena metata]